MSRVQNLADIINNKNNNNQKIIVVKDSYHFRKFICRKCKSFVRAAMINKFQSECTICCNLQYYSRSKNICELCKLPYYPYKCWNCAANIKKCEFGCKNNDKTAFHMSCHGLIIYCKECEN